MSSTALVPTQADLYALEALTEVQQVMLESLLGRFVPGSEGGGGGPVGMDVGDGGGSPLSLPVLKIRQRMTTDPACPEETKNGDLYATSGDVLSKPLLVIPVAIWTSHIKWDGSGGANIECSAPDGKLGSINLKCDACPDLPWRNNERQACDKVLNAVVLTESLSLYQVRFSGSSYTAGRTLVRFARTLPNLWSRMFHLDSASRKNPKGEFHVYEVRASGQSTGDDLAKVAEYVCHQLADARKGFLEAYYARTTGADEGQADPASDNASGIVQVTVSGAAAAASDAVPDFGDM